MQLRKLPITDSYAPWKNYLTGEDGKVLGHTIQDL